MGSHRYDCCPFERDKFERNRHVLREVSVETQAELCAGMMNYKARSTSGYRHEETVMGRMFLSLTEPGRVL